MSRRKHRAYNRMRPHQPPKGTGGRGMRTAPGPSWAKRPSTPTTLEEPQPESAQECPESQPQPEPQEKPRASEAEGGDGSQNDRVTAMARADDAMPIGQATGEIRDSWNGSRETVNVQPDPNPNNEERKDVGKNEDQREKEPPAQLEGQSKIDDLLVGLLGGGSGTGSGQALRFPSGRTGRGRWIPACCHAALGPIPSVGATLVVALIVSSDPLGAHQGRPYWLVNNDNAVECGSA